MNRLIQKIFIWLLPFLPLWAFVVTYFFHLNMYLLIDLILIPFVLILFNAGRNRVPAYLLFLFLFTIYHLYSVYSNDLVPTQTNWLFFLLGDGFVLASVFFFIIENTEFEDWCIAKINRNIFLVVILALIVSLIQIKDVTFFISTEQLSNPDQMMFFEGNRNYSIFSWIDLNSIGMTFPAFVAILLNYYERKNFPLALLVLSTILVCFLSRARYTMISGVIVLSHLVITAKYSFVKKISTLIIIVVGVLTLGLAAHLVGINLKEIINERILEKGADISESSAGARITSYNVFVRKFPEHPWFGVGPFTRPDVQAMLGEGVPIIHVGYLSYLYYYGIVGCFFFFFSLVFLLKDAFVVGLKHKFWGSFYGLLGFCLANATLVYFNLAEPGILLAVVYIRYYRFGAVKSEKNSVFENIEFRTTL